MAKKNDNIELLKKVFLLIFLLYFFLISIKLMGASFKNFKDVAHGLIQSAENPFVGLLIGILATSIVQSSSTTTSTVITMVAGGLLSIEVAIPMIMGANIGTSVTNTIVSLGNIQRENEFKRAFSASTVHDFFNVLAVMIFFPLQIFTHFLTKASTFCASFFSDFSGGKFDNFLKMLLEPVLHFFKMISGGDPYIMLAISLLLIFTVLKYLSQTLRSVFVGKLENAFDQYVFRNAGTSFSFGLILTILVQSSSISTSVIVPIAGAGFITLPQILPYTIGANIGTTTTGLMAAFVTGQATAITVAFAHFLFNVFGGSILYPIRKIPIFLATKLSEFATKNKIIPIMYILIVFFILPLSLIFFSQ